MKIKLLFLCMLFLLPLNSFAAPMLSYEETMVGSLYRYDFTLSNPDEFFVDELYVEFSLQDPYNDFQGSVSPSGWDSFSGPGADLNLTNNYWVGWMAWFGSELMLGDLLSGFSFETSSQLAGIDYSWNWDRNNHLLADGAAPVPEPSTMLLLGSGIAGLVWCRRRRK